MGKDTGIMIVLITLILSIAFIISLAMYLGHKETMSCIKNGYQQTYNGPTATPVWVKIK